MDEVELGTVAIREIDPSVELDVLDQAARLIARDVVGHERRFLDVRDELGALNTHLIGLFVLRRRFAGVSFVPGPYQERTRLGYFAIVPPFRGRGLGAQLLRAHEGLARQHGAQEMILEAYPDTDSFPEGRDAATFYQHMGYQSYGDPRDFEWIRDLRGEG